MKKLLDVCSLFMAVIGSCTAILVCYILFVYPNLGNNDSPDNNNNFAAQTTDNATDSTAPAAVYPDNVPPSETVPENNVPTNYVETELANPVSTGQSISRAENVPAEYQSALSKANDYGNIMYMSKAAIYNQLTSEYGECFSPDAAQYAIDNIVVDWNLNALQKAKDYSDTMYMSKSSIYDQLISENGEKFTPSEAQYAIDNLIADYNFNALQKARDYQNTTNMSVPAIHDQLTSEYGEKFTQEEADYAVANIETDSNGNTNSVIYTSPITQNGLNDYVATSPVQTTDTQSSFDTYNGSEPSQNATNTRWVWIDDTAAKYHKKDGCGMDNAYQVTLEEALQKGKTPCGRCYK